MTSLLSPSPAIIAPAHKPVLLGQMLAALFGDSVARAPHMPRRFVDGTFGAGGYTRAILDYEATTATEVLALDRDPNVLPYVRQVASHYSARFRFVPVCFSKLAEVLRADKFLPVDGIVLDIGVSSMQLDEAARGFSFRFTGALDMRMTPDGVSAADVVNHASADVLADIFYYFGEERAARKIARAIVHDRETKPFVTTTQLAEMIARVNPAPPMAIHPATRCFQALRIVVNDELGELLRALQAAEAILDEGGRLVVVTFHSLEDRIVKKFFNRRCGKGRAASRLLPGEIASAAPSFIMPAGQPVIATEDELADNPRARSAKLRCGVRTSASSFSTKDDEDLLPLQNFNLEEILPLSLVRRAHAALH